MPATDRGVAANTNAAGALRAETAAAAAAAARRTGRRVARGGSRRAEASGRSRATTGARTMPKSGSKNWHGKCADTRKSRARAATRATQKRGQAAPARARTKHAKKKTGTFR